MNAAEEIQAAIDKLTALKALSTPGPWFLTYENATHPRVWGNATGDDADHVATTARSARDAELITTLHRTIDTQIYWLKSIVDRMHPKRPGSSNGSLVWAQEGLSAQILARAINSTP